MYSWQSSNSQYTANYQRYESMRLILQWSEDLEIRWLGKTIWPTESKFTHFFARLPVCVWGTPKDTLDGGLLLRVVEL